MDIDGDGYPDILSGSYSRMGQPMGGLLYVLHGKPDGTFAKAEVLKGTDGEPLLIPLGGHDLAENLCTRPFAVDWDGDGKLDLVVGNFSGRFYWFKGEGNGKFRPRPEIIKSGGAPLQLKGAHHADPFVIDWDGDGCLDLLSGTTVGGVQWARSRADKGRPPELDPFDWLIKPGRQIHYGEILHEEDLTGPTSSTRIWVADVNGDGKLDVLVGDCVTLISPAKGLSVEEFKKRQAAWDKEWQAVQKEFGATQGDAAKENKARQSFAKLYEKRNEFIKEDSTGYVWLYLQK